MKMKRYYFVSDDLSDLATLEKELEDGGVTFEQIHVLSNDGAGLEEHKLHEVHSILKRDVVHSTEMGAVIGFLLAMLVLIGAYLSGLPETMTWVPFIFLAVIVQGFCAWEGGLLGIQIPNAAFKRFESALKRGKHVFFVDIEPQQKRVLRSIVKKHPGVRPAGKGDSSPGWLVHWQQTWHRFLKWAP